MSELNFLLHELRKLKEGGESFCSCMGLDTSPLRAPINEIALCCLLCLTSPETVPVRIVWDGVFLPVCFLVVSPLLVFSIELFHIIYSLLYCFALFWNYLTN